MTLGRALIVAQPPQDIIIVVTLDFDAIFVINTFQRECTSIGTATANLAALLLTRGGFCRGGPSRGHPKNRGDD
jgi:hypothetical protein